MTHDYERNGTVDLFAALNAATGEVCSSRAWTTASIAFGAASGAAASLR